MRIFQQKNGMHWTDDGLRGPLYAGEVINSNCVSVYRGEAVAGMLAETTPVTRQWEDLDMIIRRGSPALLGSALCLLFAGVASARDRQADLNDIQYACGQPPDDGDTFGGQPYRYAVISVLDATEDGSESSKKYLVDSRYAEMESSPYMACVFGRRLQQISVVPARTPPPPSPPPPSRPSH